MPKRKLVRTANVFEAILGRRAIKWDAFWHLFEWLVDPEQDHGLDDKIGRKLLEFVFGESYSQFETQREFPVSGQTDGKGKWADFAVAVPTLASPTRLIVMDDIGAANSGNKRKLSNLSEYLRLAHEFHPGAIIRVVAITDARTKDELSPVVFEHLHERATSDTGPTGWKLLHLHELGEWVEQAIAEPQTKLLDPTVVSLRQFIKWCG